MKFNVWGLGLALTVLGAGSALATTFDDVTEFETRLEKLQDGFTKAQAERMKAYRAAETDKDKMAALNANPWTAFEPQARQLAEDADGTDVAAQAWGMVFDNFDRNGDQEEQWDIFGILINDYADSSALINVVANVQFAGRGQKRALEGLRTLVENTSMGRTKAASYMSLAKLLESDEATNAEALKLYRLIVKDFSEYKNGRGDTYASLASGSIFEAEKLQVGMPVPEFTSIDEADASFKVSDYKGKVVLLDFWGFW